MQTIKVEREVWKELLDIKVDKNKKTFNDVIILLLNKRGIKNERN